MPHRSSVRPPVGRLTEEEARQSLASGLLRLCSANGPSRVGLEAGCDEKTIRNARDQKSTLRLDLAFNLLALDPTALNELAGRYGFKLTPITAQYANDLHTAAGLLDGASELIKAQEDGVRDNTETCRVADILRPHLPAAVAIVQQADQLRARTV